MRGNQPLHFLQVLGAFLDLIRTKLDLDQRVTAILKMQDRIRLESVFCILGLFGFVFSRNFVLYFWDSRQIHHHL